MIYNYNGVLIHDSFSDNMVFDYAYDAATGANYTVIRVFQTKRDGTKQYPFLRYPGRMKTADLVAAENWGLVINAGLGVSEEQPIDGVAIENGVVKNNDPATYHQGAIPLTISSSGVLSTAAADATASSLVSSGIKSATCGFCAIVEDYLPSESFPTVANVTHFTDNAQRQIIGQWGNGDYAIVTCAGRSNENSDGWTLTEAQTVCVKLGLKFAYNLDGGNSTSTYLRKNKIHDNQIGTSRVIPSFIVFNGTTTFSIPT